MAVGDKWISKGFLCGQYFISAGAVIEQTDHDPPKYVIMKGVDSAPQGYVFPEHWWPQTDVPPALAQVVPHQGE